MRSRPAIGRLNRSVLLVGSVICVLASLALLLMMIPGLYKL